MYRRITLLLSGMLTLLFGATFTSQATLSHHFVIYGVNSISCTLTGNSFLIYIANESSDTLYFDTLVYDDNEIYMDEYITNSQKGFRNWGVFNVNHRGLQTTSAAGLTLPNKSSFHFLVTLRNESGIALAYSHVHVTHCKKGIYTIRQGEVLSLTYNADMQSVAGGFPDLWTLTNISAPDGSVCEANGGYRSTCSTRIDSSTTLKKKMVTDLVMMDTFPLTDAGIRLEAWGLQNGNLDKQIKIKGVITYKNGTKQVIKTKLTSRALNTWQYYMTLPVNVQGAVASFKTQLVVPAQISTGGVTNFIDNLGLLIYLNNENFHATRNMPPLPLPGTDIPMGNGFQQ